MVKTVEPVARECDWVDLSGLPPGVDPYALAVPRKALSIDQWLLVRRMGIGSSDIATVLGENPYKTPFALYQEKIGEWPPDDLSDNEAVQIGSDLEEYCGRRFAARMGRDVRRDNFVRRSPKFPFLLCDVDFDVAATVEEPSAIAECKTSLGRAAFTDLWGEGPTDVPDSHLLQLTEQMIVKTRTVGFIPALLAGPTFRVYRLDFNVKLQAIIVDGAREFFQRLIDRNPPPVTALADAKRAFPTARAIEVQATAEIVDAVSMLRDAKRDFKDADADVKLWQGKIAGFMGDADTLVRGKDRLLTYKNQYKDAYSVKASDSRVMRLEKE